MKSDASDEAFAPSFYIGQHETKRSLPVSRDVVQLAQKSGYDMMTTPITTPYFHQRVLALLSLHFSQIDSENEGLDSIPSTNNTVPLVVPPLGALDTSLAPNDTNSQLLALSSSWIDLCSPDPVIANVSRQVLHLEANYAAFCGFTNLIVPGPRFFRSKINNSGLVQYARAIQELFRLGQYAEITIWMPMTEVPDWEAEGTEGDFAPFAREQYLENEEENVKEEQTKKVDLLGAWECWNSIRTMCKYNPRLFVAISLPKRLANTSVQSRWGSEPLRFISISSKSFVLNAHKYPVLPSTFQALITRYMRLKTPPWILLCDVGPISDPNNRPTPTSPTPVEAAHLQHRHSHKKYRDPTPHLSYIRNLQTKQPPRTPMERFAAGFQDYLQAPLQPLTDNLESITYEVFEKDPVKYEWYERAMIRALRDWIKEGKPTSGPSGKVVVAVVGAGRGPLVTRALRASKEVGVDIELWAVEKNPNAFVLLQQHNEHDWNNSVHLVQSDMRSWKGPSCAVDPVSPSQIPPVTPTTAVQEHPVTPPRLDSPIVVQATTPSGHPSPATSEMYAEVLMRSKRTPSQAVDQNINTNVKTLPQSTTYPIDIVISELLGSFGDNELSPECLDGITPLLNPTHGISIPCSYTAHVTPIAAPKLHADIQTREAMHHEKNAADTPYVVMLSAIDFLSTSLPMPTQAAAAPSKNPSAPASDGATPANKTTAATAIVGAGPHPPVVKTVWEFTHGPTACTPPTNVHNQRFANVEFRVRDRGVCHGLAGYFETVLYRSSKPPSIHVEGKPDDGHEQNKETQQCSVELSTNPLTMDAKSKDMISWFPIYFPLKTPLFIPDNSTLSVSLWRQTSDRKVWYEWCIDVFSKTGSRIAGSGLMSSESGACQM